MLQDNGETESSYWFPQELLEWNLEEDQDLVYNISKIPLAQRVDQEYLTPVNETQNKDTRVMAISIMNSSTSGNAPRGIVMPLPFRAAFVWKLPVEWGVVAVQSDQLFKCVPVFLRFRSYKWIRKLT